MAEYGHKLKRQNLAARSAAESAASIETLIPQSRPGLLRPLSRSKLSAEEVRISAFCFVVTRECEQFAREGALDAETTTRDLERLERLIDDFTMQHRSQVSNEIRIAVWVARLKLANLRFNVLQPAHAAATSANDSSDTGSSRVNDPLRRLALGISNEQLAQWMYDNEACDDNVLHYDAHTDGYTHSLQSCGVTALWNSIMALKDRWPYLGLSAYVYAMFEQLRQRVAFFASYREVLDESQQRSEARRRHNVLGLSVDRWRVVDAPPGSARGNPVAEHEYDYDSKLNSVQFMSIKHVNGGDSYASVNQDFIEETERMLNNIMIELRKCCGFEWHIDPVRKQCDCLACEQLASADSTAQAERLFDDFVADELVGPFRDFTQKDFRELVWETYEQPSERENFLTFHPYDKASAQNFILRQRHADGKHIQQHYVDEQIDAVWSVLCETDGEQPQPPYPLLAMLATNFHIQAHCNGALLRPYSIDCAGNEPFTFDAERFARVRNCMAEFHTEMTTTGTLKLRRYVLPRLGLSAAGRDRFYEHPLIVKTLGSFCVLYGERMHNCPGGFAQAFCVWLAVMCEDVKIGGELCNSASLYPLYARLFPSRAEKIRRLESQVHRTARQWDPTQRFLPDDQMQLKPEELADVTQFE